MKTYTYMKTVAWVRCAEEMVIRESKKSKRRVRHATDSP
jgi:hypothetical protein